MGKREAFGVMLSAEEKALLKKLADRHLVKMSGLLRSAAYAVLTRLEKMDIEGPIDFEEIWSQLLGGSDPMQ